MTEEWRAGLDGLIGLSEKGCRATGSYDCLQVHAVVRLTVWNSPTSTSKSVWFIARGERLKRSFSMTSEQTPRRRSRGRRYVGAALLTLLGGSLACCLGCGVFFT